MSDSRFSALATDPRYRLPNRKESRMAVDPRFKRLFTDQDFRKKASVDRYGRKIKPGSGKKDLEKLYRLETEDASQRHGTGKVEREVVGSSDEDSGLEDLAEDELVERRDAARDGGFSGSESEEESTSDEGSENEDEIAEETAGVEQTEDIPTGEVSHRIAAVNLDWDNIRATDIMAVASSFIPANGRIESVTIYPSEFGRERLEREELEGPPREIFASSHVDTAVNEEDEESDEASEEDDENIKRQLQQNQVNEGDEYDTTMLRQYQLERLRYYYAVISCDSNSTGKALYDAMDGREYLTTANFFDLRFVPDETSFEDDKPRDECRQLAPGYKPNEFRTEALTHSKVRLTWDDDDTTRKEVQKRAFSRAEMDENDLQAYIGSESSDAESVASRKSAVEERRVRKKEAKRTDLRAALGLSDEPSKSSRNGKEQVVGDMEITFTSSLGGGKAKEDGKGVFENEPQDAESTRARYIRKERERKQKRKERMKSARSEGAAEAESAANATEDAETRPVDEDLGFDDPFFNDPSTAVAKEKKAKKAEKHKKLAAQAAKDEEAAARRAELELLMAEDKGDNLQHFDMREIEKSEKEARRKSKKGKKDKKTDAKHDIGVGRDDFRVQTQDPRFKALFDSHEYAIDPTNPRFKGTQGMKALLEEGRKRKRVDVEDEQALENRKSTKMVGAGSAKDDDLDGLVARLKGARQGKKR